MEKLALKNKISEVIERWQGIKSTEIPVKLADENIYTRGNELVELVQEMVDRGELVEVEYILPPMNYMVKSFLLPKGTIIRIAVIEGEPNENVE